MKLLQLKITPKNMATAVILRMDLQKKEIVAKLKDFDRNLREARTVLG